MQAKIAHWTAVVKEANGPPLDQGWAFVAKRRGRTGFAGAALTIDPLAATVISREEVLP
jgi:hypothetical protein